MKILKVLIATVCALAIVGLTTSTFAAEKAAKEKTMTGTLKCGKCALKETDECQGVLERSGKNGKTTKIYLENNDISKDFHKNICKEADGKKVKVTGTTKKEGGKNVLVASKIEAVE